MALNHIVSYKIFKTNDILYQNGGFDVNLNRFIFHISDNRIGVNSICTAIGAPIFLCTDIVKKKESGVRRVGSWNCHDCKASFKITCGTSVLFMCNISRRN